MGQIVRGTLAFASENGGKFPPNRYQPDRTRPSEHYTWRYYVHLEGYVNDAGLWACPNAPSITTELGVSIHGSRCIGDFDANYAYNGASFWRFGPVGAPDGSDRNRYGMPSGRAELTLRNVRDPKETMVLLETRAIYPDLGDWTVFWDYGDGGGPLPFWHQNQGHNGGNWAMADGHVRWSKLFDTGNPDCWWHNIDEQPNRHLDWAGGMAFLYR